MTILRQVFLAHDFVDVPGNGLTFAVEVSGEINGFSLLRRLDDLVDVFAAALAEFVVHAESMFCVDRPILGGQIANMPIGRQHLEVFPQVSIDGVRLGRRLHDEQVFGHEFPLHFNNKTCRYAVTVQVL